MSENLPRLRDLWDSYANIALRRWSRDSPDWHSQRRAFYSGVFSLLVAQRECAPDDDAAGIAWFEGLVAEFDAFVLAETTRAGHAH